MKLKRLAPIFLVILAFIFSAIPSMAFDPNQLVFGDNTNVRPAPTSGTLIGTYKTAQDWVQTGPIDCYHCLLYFGGNATFAYSVTSHPEVPGGNAGAYCTTQNGTGYGGGGGYGSYGTTGGGGGAGFGGAGGPGGYESSVPNGGGVGGSTYPADFSLNGSGGGAGTQYSTFAGGNGGLGGDGIYIECSKAVTINAAITCNGGTGGASAPGGSAGAGGGGSGGNFDCRALGGITIGSSGNISCNGGTGGAAGDPSGFSGGGGGGGYVNLQPGPGNTTVNNGSVTANAGAHGSGTSGTQLGVAGSTGVINLNNTFRGARFGF